MMAGIDQAPTNLPVEGMAGGGIVSFAGGGTPKFDYKPTNLDYSYLDKLGTSGLDEEGKPYTEESYAAKQREKEKAMGFKNFFDERMADVAKQKEDLVGQKDTAKGLALLQASGKILENANKPGLMGIGAGISGFNEVYAPALKDIRANEALIRKETYSAQDAKNAMIQAQMAGDKVGYQAARKEYTDHITRVGEANNANKTLQNTVGLEGAKAEYNYATDIAKQILENTGKANAARISASSGADGHLNQVMANSITELTAAKTQHASQYDKTKVNSEQAKIDAYTVALEKAGGDESKVSKLVKDNATAAQNYINGYTSSQARINSIEKKYMPLIVSNAKKAGYSEAEIKTMLGDIQKNTTTTAPNEAGKSGPKAADFDG
jgi:hypothetical protein